MLGDITGLILWHEESGNKKGLASATKIADLICQKFLENTRNRLVGTGSTEMNLAVIHTLCLPPPENENRAVSGYGT